MVGCSADSGLRSCHPRWKEPKGKAVGDSAGKQAWGWSVESTCSAQIRERLTDCGRGAGPPNLYRAARVWPEGGGTGLLPSRNPVCLTLNSSAFLGRSSALRVIPANICALFTVPSTYQLP